MAKKEKAKKTFYKKWWVWVIAIIIIGAAATSGEEEDQQTANKKSEPASSEVSDDKTAAEKPAEEKKKPKKEDTEKKEPAKKEKKENLTIDKKIEKNNDNVDKATLEDGKLILVGEGKTTFSENTLFMSVYDLFEAMHEGFQDKNVNEVFIEITTKMVDSKGNESVEPVIKYNYSRESFEELNYDKFSDMAYSEEWRILTEADYYYIHPGIYKNLKDKYKDHVNVEGFNN